MNTNIEEELTGEACYGHTKSKYNKYLELVKKIGSDVVVHDILIGFLDDGELTDFIYEMQDRIKLHERNTECMNTSQHIASKMTQEFKVQLNGAYQGKYRVLVMRKEGLENETLVFTDTERPIHIHNQDIVDLVTETILLPQ
jgi:5'(3')-deoxyribonucleotidase